MKQNVVNDEDAPPPKCEHCEGKGKIEDENLICDCVYCIGTGKKLSVVKEKE